MSAMHYYSSCLDLQNSNRRSRDFRPGVSDCSGARYDREYKRVTSVLQNFKEACSHPACSAQAVILQSLELSDRVY